MKKKTAQVVKSSAGVKSSVWQPSLAGVNQSKIVSPACTPVGRRQIAQRPTAWQQLCAYTGLVTSPNTPTAGQQCCLTPPLWHTQAARQHAPEMSSSLSKRSRRESKRDSLRLASASISSSLLGWPARRISNAATAANLRAGIVSHRPWVHSLQQVQYLLLKPHLPRARGSPSFSAFLTISALATIDLQALTHLHEWLVGLPAVRGHRCSSSSLLSPLLGQLMALLCLVQQLRLLQQLRAQPTLHVGCRGL